jgi:alkylation response protein AidB-like acyl-CoA dehydrogenase
MDFELSDDQAAIAELAGKILADRCSPEALRAHEASGEPLLLPAWRSLAEADLLGVALPEAADGGGYGVLGAWLVAEQVGRHVAPVPYAATLACALVLGRLGGHEELLRAVVAGDAVLAPALGESSVVASATDDRTGGDSRPHGGGDPPTFLSGRRGSVPWAREASFLLVPADGAGGERGLYLVDVVAAGVTLTPEDAMWRLPQATVELEAAPAERVGDAEAARQLERIAVALACATVAGVCEGALRITAGYVSEREQFGTKIGTFQAVAQRMADAYIDTQGVRLTALQAAWRLAEGLPADEELHIAKFWAADAGHRVVHAAQHLHGGIGMDVDYPIHRYFRWAKVLELQLGGATDHLRRLGALLAASSPPPA